MNRLPIVASSVALSLSASLVAVAPASGAEPVPWGPAHLLADSFSYGDDLGHASARSAHHAAVLTTPRCQPGGRLSVLTR